MAEKEMKMADSLDLQINQDRADILLAEVMDLSLAQPFLETLQQCCSEQREIVLNASGVRRVSTACVQVLLSAGRSVEAAGGEFIIKNASPDFSQSIHDLGLGVYLKKWSRD